MSLLIRSGTIVTASDMYQGDVLVEGEKITTIGASLSMPADRVIDASGKYVFPGGIDVHTHLNMPFGGTTSADDFESGTIAAAHGGTTTIVDFAIQYRGQTLHHAWETWMQKAEGKAAIDYGFHMKLGMNHPMGPLTLADFIGLDVCLAILEVLHEGLGDPKYRPCPLLRRMVAAGHLGRKSGRGFYTY